MGFREYKNKARFENIQNDEKHNVFKIIATNGDYFEIDVKNYKITG